MTVVSRATSQRRLYQAAMSSDRVTAVSVACWRQMARLGAGGVSSGAVPLETVGLNGQIPAVGGFAASLVTKDGAGLGRGTRFQ